MVRRNPHSPEEYALSHPLYDLKQGIVSPLYPLKAYESVNLKNFSDSLIVPSLDSSHLFKRVIANKSLLKMFPFLSLSRLENLQ